MLTHLPHRVSIMSESRTTISGGCYTTSWASNSIEWANCQLDSTSFFSVQENHKDYQKKQQFNFYHIKMRSDVTISNKNRLIFHDSTDKILSIETVSNPTNRKRMLEIKAREEVL